MEKAKKSLIILVLLCYFANYLLEKEIIGMALSISTFLLLLVTIPTAKFMSKIMGILLLGFGFFISFYLNESNLTDSIEGVNLNLPLLILILLAPLISIPLKSSGHLNTIFQYIDEVRNEPQKIFFSISGFLSLLTPILNIGSVRIIDDLMGKKSLSSELLGRAYFTGFSTAMVWSPYFGSVALVLYYLEVPYSKYFVIGFLFAVAQLFVGNFLFIYKYRKSKIASAKSLKSNQSNLTIFPFIIKFITMMGLLISFLIFFEAVTNISMLMLVSIVAIAIPFTWAIIFGKWKEFIQQVKKYQIQIQNGMDTEIVLFLSAGIFGNAISNSYISLWIKEFLLLISNISFFFFIIFIIFIVMFCAFIGLHQIITVPILALQIQPEVIGVDSVIIAFLLILAWFLSAIFSPFNAITVIISNAVNKKAMTVGFRWNGLYVGLMFCIGCLFILILQLAYS